MGGDREEGREGEERIREKGKERDRGINQSHSIYCL